MKISDQGLQLLIEREGKKNQAYQDTVGVWTIGVGHTGPEVGPGLIWSDEQIENALREDVARFERAVNSGVGQGVLTQYQFDALVSFAFNVGVGAFLGSTMLKKIRVRDYEGAALQFDRWNIPKEIVPRRRGEREQFRGAVFLARVYT